MKKYIILASLVLASLQAYAERPRYLVLEDLAKQNNELSTLIISTLGDACPQLDSFEQQIVDYFSVSGISPRQAGGSLGTLSTKLSTVADKYDRLLQKTIDAASIPDNFSPAFQELGLQVARQLSAVNHIVDNFSRVLSDEIDGVSWLRHSNSEVHDRLKTVETLKKLFECDSLLDFYIETYMPPITSTAASLGLAKLVNDYLTMRNANLAWIAKINGMRKKLSTFKTLDPSPNTTPKADSRPYEHQEAPDSGAFHDFFGQGSNAVSSRGLSPDQEFKRHTQESLDKLLGKKKKSEAKGKGKERETSTKQSAVNETKCMPAYQSEAYEEWYAAIDDDDLRRVVDRRVADLRCGRPGDAHGVGRGVMELRFGKSYDNGLRIYYVVLGEPASVYLILVGNKDTERQQEQDIELSIEAAHHLKTQI